MGAYSHGPHHDCNYIASKLQAPLRVQGGGVSEQRERERRERERERGEAIGVPWKTL